MLFLAHNVRSKWIRPSSYLGPIPPTRHGSARPYLKSDMNQEKSFVKYFLTYSNVYWDIKHLFPLTKKLICHLQWLYTFGLYWLIRVDSTLIKWLYNVPLYGCISKTTKRNLNYTSGFKILNKIFPAGNLFTCFYLHVLNRYNIYNETEHTCYKINIYFNLQLCNYDLFSAVLM